MPIYEDKDADTAQTFLTVALQSTNRQMAQDDTLDSIAWSLLSIAKSQRLLADSEASARVIQWADREKPRLEQELAEAQAAISRVRYECGIVLTDDQSHLNAVGQHLLGSVACVAEKVLAALDNDQADLGVRCERDHA